MTHTPSIATRLTLLRLFGAGIGLLLLSACASPPTPPDQALQAAESAISHAEQARVADYASPELGIAREKLTAANAAVQREEMLLAERLADQSRVEAELALAKSQAAKAKDSAALVKAMQARYPKLAGVASLELSAKVAKGEIQWP